MATNTEIIGLVTVLFIFLWIIWLFWNYGLRREYFTIFRWKQVKKIKEEIINHDSMKLSPDARIEFYLKNEVIKGKHRDLILLAEKSIMNDIKKLSGGKNGITAVSGKKDAVAEATATARVSNRRRIIVRRNR